MNEDRLWSDFDECEMYGEPVRRINVLCSAFWGAVGIVCLAVLGWLIWR